MEIFLSAILLIVPVTDFVCVSVCSEVAFGLADGAGLTDGVGVVEGDGLPDVDGVDDAIGEVDGFADEFGLTELSGFTEFSGLAEASVFATALFDGVPAFIGDALASILSITSELLNFLNGISLGAGVASSSDDGVLVDTGATVSSSVFTSALTSVLTSVFAADLSSVAVAEAELGLTTVSVFTLISCFCAAFSSAFTAGTVIEHKIADTSISTVIFFFTLEIPPLFKWTYSVRNTQSVANLSTFRFFLRR
jgi:hypothetical protein